MDCETIYLRLVGTKRLLMHNGRLADPLADATKALARLTGKRAKTISDHEEIGRVEWNGGLWLDGGRPCVPAEDPCTDFPFGSERDDPLRCR